MEQKSIVIEIKYFINIQCMTVVVQWDLEAQPIEAHWMGVPCFSDWNGYGEEFMFISNMEKPYNKTTFILKELGRIIRMLS